MSGPSAGREPSWFEATARARITGLVDGGSFQEILPPQDRITSPHLAMFELPCAFDDGMVVGRAVLDGRPILIAAQEGQFMGGTFAEISGAKLVGLLRAARNDETLPRMILLLLDSGGVRLQEANAGELAVAEVIRAIVEARAAGVAVMALVGGRSGAFGGAGLIAATCSRIIISERGRIGVTGPEVIETNKGVEEFDSSDKALVWSMTGGRNRMLIGGADDYAADSAKGFRDAVLASWGSVPGFCFETLQAEHARLTARLGRFSDIETFPDLARQLGIDRDIRISDLDEAEFQSLAQAHGVTSHDAR